MVVLIIQIVYYMLLYNIKATSFFVNVLAFVVKKIPLFLFHKKVTRIRKIPGFWQHCVYSKFVNCMDQPIIYKLIAEISLKSVIFSHLYIRNKAFPFKGISPGLLSPGTHYLIWYIPACSFLNFTILKVNLMCC